MAQTITNNQVGITNPNEEDQQKPAGQSTSPTQQSSGGQSNIQGASGNSSSNSTGNVPVVGQQQASTGQAAKQGSGFTNLQNIINANQNNNLGSTISTDLNNYSGQAQNGINTAQNNFSQQANQYNYNTSENQNQANNTINGIVNSSNSPTVTPTQQSQFGTWINGSYQGPNSLSDVNAGLQNQVNDVSGLANSGNSGLLQRFVGGQNYTSGEQNLDNVLLNATGGSQVQQAKNNAANVSNQYNQANTGAQNQAQTIQQQNQAFSNQLLGNIGSNFQTIYGNAENSATTDTANMQGLVSGLQNNNLTASQAQQLGLNLGQSEYGVSPTTYLNSLTPTVTAAQAMSPQQLAQLQALSSLSNGQLNSNLTNDISGLNSSNINSYDPGSIFNSSAYNTAQQNAQQSYNQNFENQTVSDLASGAGYLGASNNTQSAQQQLNDFLNGTSSSIFDAGISGAESPLQAAESLQKEQGAIAYAPQAYNSQAAASAAALQSLINGYNTGTTLQ